MPPAVTGHRQGVDRMHLVAGREQRLHPPPSVGLDPDHHRGRLLLAEVIGDQRVQRGHPGHPFGQPPAGQPPTRFVLHFHIVVSLGPVVTDEQHAVSLPLGTGAGHARTP